MKRSKRVGILATLMVLLFGAGVTEIAVATAVGDGYSVAGVNIGWIAIVLATICGIIAIAGKVSGTITTKGIKYLIVPFLAFVVVGVILVFVQVEVPTAEAVGKYPDFKITGTAVTSGTNYITTVNWDEDENLFTIPLTVADSSDGNLSCHITALNFTLDPIAGGRIATIMATIYMSSDYTTTYGGEDIFDKTGSYYDVNWTSSTGTESYEDTQDMQVSEESWAVLTWEFNNGTAGNWVTELDAIGNSITWYINFWNEDMSWSEAITVTATVVSYTE